jgi:flagellar biosynthesis protein FlhA
MTNFFKQASKYSDLVAAGAVVLVVVMMIIPLPPFVLDLAITLNVSVALAIVVSTLYMPRAIDFSSFPSLLLLTTLFRLAINVSVTRLILLHGDAGTSSRPSAASSSAATSSSARHLPHPRRHPVRGRHRRCGPRSRGRGALHPRRHAGKQMAIDADLNAGPDHRGRSPPPARGHRPRGRLLRRDGRRLEVRQGRRDGGGAHHRDQPHRRHRHRRGPAGPAALGGRPALLAAQRRRRPGRADPRAAHLGRDRHHRHALGLQGRPRHRRRQADHQPAQGPLVAGAVIASFALVPGLPKIPFLIIGGIFFMAGRAITSVLAEREATQAQEAAAAALPAPATPRDQALEALSIDPVELSIGFGLVPLVDGGTGGSLLARVGAVRRQVAADLGAVIPPVRIHDDVALGSHEYVMKVRGNEVARGSIMAGHQLALDPGDAVGQLAGIPTTEPAYGLPAVWIPDPARAEAEALGYTVVDAESVIVTHLTETIRSHVADLLTRQDVRALLDRLKESNAAVVEEVVPDLLSVGEIQRVLQSLLREGVSIRDLGAIVEVVGDRARVTRDPVLLAEYARQALGRAIVMPHVDAEQRLRAISLDPAIEQEISDSIAQTADGEYLAMEPTRAHALVSSLATQAEHAVARGGRPVVICSSRVRRHLRRLVEQNLPQLSICAYNEIAPGISVETIGVVSA